MTTSSKYHSFHDLTAGESSGYRIEWISRISKVLIITPHGGEIEPGTSEIVRALAGNEFSWYCFEGTRLDGNKHLHITSTRFDEPVSAGMLDLAHAVFAVHGCRSRRKIVFVGGLHNEWVLRFIDAFQQAGFEAERGEYNISGSSPRNICNRGNGRKGVQIELTEGLRKDLFLALDGAGRKQTTPLFDRLIQAGRQTLLEINAELF
jgi:phage replication-related protein YjqB (UPF0714/DUF867 family)